MKRISLSLLLMLISLYAPAQSLHPPKPFPALESETLETDFGILKPNIINSKASKAIPCKNYNMTGLIMGKFII